MNKKRPYLEIWKDSLVFFFVLCLFLILLLGDILVVYMTKIMNAFCRYRSYIVFIF